MTEQCALYFILSQKASGSKMGGSSTGFTAAEKQLLVVLLCLLVVLLCFEDFGGIIWEVPGLVCGQDNVRVRDRLPNLCLRTFF